MEPIVKEVVFSAGEAEYRWGDVVHAARFWGDWGELERVTALGIACRRRLDELGEEVPSDEVERAGDEWRYARSLLAADDLDAWLQERRTTQEEWFEYLRRSILRDRWQPELAEIEKRYPLSPEEVEAFVWIEGTCSGTLGMLAEKLARRAAVYERDQEECVQINRPQDPAVRRSPEPEVLERSYQRFTASLLVPGPLTREVETHALEWTRLDNHLAIFAEEEVASEAALLVREDGMGFAKAAKTAGTTLRKGMFYIEDAGARLRDHLMAAQAGQLLGPLPLEEGWILLAIDDRVPPAIDDPAVLERAHRVVVDRAVDREVNRWIRWHRLP